MSEDKIFFHNSETCPKCQNKGLKLWQVELAGNYPYLDGPDNAKFGRKYCCESCNLYWIIKRG